jgi:hypothetical protein
MAETRLVVEHREQLWSLLVQAAQIEHMIMCQYLYACFSLKTGPDESLTAEQADAVARWQETVTGIAIEEMLHLALVMNVMTAIGAAPTLSRPNFPRHSVFLPPGVEFALLPFGADSLAHFLYRERPEGMERVDAAEFVPAAPPPEPVGQAEVMPRLQGFLTVGHLYRGIEQGLNDLAVPWRNAAWVLLSERAAVLSRQCAECAMQDGAPEEVSAAAATAAAISEQFAGHVPQDLRPA